MAIESMTDWSMQPSPFFSYSRSHAHSNVFFLAALWNIQGRPLYFLSMWFLPSSSSSFFLSVFLAYSQPSQIGCLPYTSTHDVALVRIYDAGLKCDARGSQKIAKNSPSAHHRTTLSGYIYATKARIDNRKNVLNSNSIPPPHVLTIYGELRPTSGWARFVSLGHPSKFERVSRLGFVTATASLNGSQSNFARCLAVSRAGIYTIHFWGSCPVTEFCQVQNSLCVQVLRSPIGSDTSRRHRVVGVSQTLRRWAEHLYSAGRSSRWTLAHILVGPVSYIRISLCYFYFRWKGICCLQIYNRLI